MDDVLSVVPANQVDKMLAHINSIDHNIQFTSEREVEHVIPFLDVEIMLALSLPRCTESPPTQINYLQFSSHHSMAHKRSVVSTLLKRAASHCSSNSLVRKEKAYVKETSALAQHAWENHHHINWTSACILGTESHYCSRLSREAIYIHRQPSSLNRDRGTLPDVYQRRFDRKYSHNL